MRRGGEDVVEEVSAGRGDGQVSDASKEIRRNTYSSSHRSLFSRSRRAGGGNYSSGNLHKPVGGTATFLFGHEANFNVVDGDSGISHSVINRRHNQKREVKAYEPSNGAASTSSRRAIRLPNSLSQLSPLEPRSPKRDNRCRTDSLVSQYNIQSPSTTPEMGEQSHRGQGKGEAERPEFGNVSNDGDVVAAGGGTMTSLTKVEEGFLKRQELVLIGVSPTVRVRGCEKRAAQEPFPMVVFP